MLKRTFILMFVLITFQSICKAQDCYIHKLSKIEGNIFNIEYNKQNVNTRLKRIEENIYGLAKTGTIENRINRLSKDLSIDVIEQKIEPKKDSFLSDDEIITEKPVEDKDMDFSVVNDLEKKVFQYEFKTLNVSNRLSALESQVFKKCYLKDDINTRISRLKEAVYYKKLAEEENKTTIKQNLGEKKLNTEESQKISNCVNIIQNNEKMGIDSNIKIVSLEKALFNASFPKESHSKRLARIETKIFQTDFIDEDNETRLNRVLSAKEAQNSIKKYRSNKGSQHVATAIELGTILLIFLPLLL